VKRLPRVVGAFSRGGTPNVWRSIPSGCGRRDSQAASGRVRWLGRWGSSGAGKTRQRLHRLATGGRGFGWPYRSGRSANCVKVKNPIAPAITREAEVDWAVKAVGVVVVRCFRCQHRGVLSRNDLIRFGLKPDAPITAYVKRLRCSECGHGEADDVAEH
jgi:hypothetical protein